MAYGLPNKVMTELSTQLFKHEHLTKFLYYTSKDYETKDLLLEKKVSASNLINKNIFVGRRVPIILQQSGAFISFRVFDYRPFKKQGICDVQIDVDVIVHQDCMKTIHGARDITITTMVHEALENISEIGQCQILSTYDIRDISVEYSGYTIRFGIKGFVAHDK